MKGSENVEDTVIVGRHAVKEAIVSGHAINKILIQDGIKKQQINEILKNAKAQKLIVQTVPKSKLDFLSNAPHQGVAALVAPYEYEDFDEFLQSQKNKDGFSTILILDGLEDPHNLGSILRTADATGAIQHVPVIRVTNLSKTIDELKENGFWVAGTEASNATDYRDLQADMSLAIVIGSEGQGMSRLVSDKCDFYIKIPMVGHVNSLNASVAASLMMYEVFRKRDETGEMS